MNPAAPRAGHGAAAPEPYMARERARGRSGSVRGARVVSRYEAGRDGCGLQRTPRSIAADDAAVVSSSIEVSRRLYRATTDRIDGKKSLDVSARYRAGDGGSRSVVQVSQRTDRGSIPLPRIPIPRRSVSVPGSGPHRRQCAAETRTIPSMHYMLR